MPFQYKDHRNTGLRRPFVTYGPRVNEDLRRKVLVAQRPGYDVWEETYQLGSTTGPKDRMTLRVARTKAGHWIGEPDQAKYLVDQKGIAPELLAPDSNVCSIGFSAKDGKWYGWSHRAIYGFRPGDVVKTGDCHADTIPPGTKAMDDAGAKWFASEFARAVS